MRQLTEEKYKGYVIFFTKQQIAPYTVSCQILKEGKVVDETYGYDKEDCFEKAKNIINGV